MLAIIAALKPDPDPFIFMWIPYFQAAGSSDWKMLRFDVATMQPNWAFHSHPGFAELFAKVANDTSCAGMGVEMELPLSKLRQLHRGEPEVQMGTHAADILLRQLVRGDGGG